MSRRVGSWPLPSARFLPGEGRPPSGVPAPGDPAEAFAYACDLFDHRYWWEAHEVWEHLWQPLPREGLDAQLLQGLIQCAAALLTAELGRQAASERLARRGTERLRRVVDARGAVVRGIALPTLIEGIGAALAGGPPPRL